MNVRSDRADSRACVEGATLIAIGKTLYSLPLKGEAQDLVTYRALIPAAGLKGVALIVQAPVRWFRSEWVGPIHVFLIPALNNHALNHLWFVLAAVIHGLRIARGRKVIVQSSEPTAAGPAGLIISRLRRVPFLVHLQGQVLALPREFSGSRRRLSRLVGGFVCRRADLVRCVSSALLDEARGAGVAPQRTMLVPPRCDVSVFDPALHAEDGRRVRAELGLEDRTVLLFVGALTPHKGLRHLMSALAELKGDYPRLTLLLVGDGPLRPEVDRFGQDGTIRLLGRVSHGEIPRYMAAADAFVLPSIDEGMPRVVLEALAMQMPVIATRVGGIPDVIKPGVTGFLVEPGNARSLADGVRSYLEEADPSSMGKEGRRLIERVYSFDVGIRGLAEALMRACLNRREP